jgi:LacI family transcriptional regulator
MALTDRKPGKARHTIRDIAAMAGVSRSTVSLALNDSPKINAATKAHILELIEKVGYRPNQMARNLVRQSSGMVCVILPKIDHVVADTYFAESLSGILEVITARGHHMMVEMATDTFKEEGRAGKLFRQGAMDGVLCVGSLTTDTYLVDLAEAGCPVVLVNSSLPGVPQVIGDNREAARQAVAHLHALGHRRIALIKGSEFVTTAIHRTEGYLKGIAELGLENTADLVAEGFFDQKSGYLAMRWLLSRPKRPTAVFTTNDMMAIGALDALREAKLRCPQDVALFGGDDIDLARYTTPRLSTLTQNMFAIGQAACEKLFRRIAGEEVDELTEVPLQLVIRESCGAGKA